MGRNVSLFTVLSFRIASQLRPNRPPLFIFLNVFYDGLGVSCGRLAGTLVFPVLGVGWVGTQIFFLFFVVGPTRIRRGGEGWAGFLVFKGIPNPFPFRDFSFIFIGRIFG